jgi:hypothetical protein
MFSAEFWGIMFTQTHSLSAPKEFAIKLESQIRIHAIYNTK